MRKQRPILGLAAMLNSLLLAGAVLAAPAATEITRWVMAGGGGHSQTGVYTLDGTIGQSVVGQAAVAGYELSSGFWVTAGSPAGGERIYLPLVLRNGEANSRFDVR